MQAGMYVALSGQQVLQRQLVNVANNVANINTAGFRAESVNFESLVSTSEPDLVYYAKVGETNPSLKQGTLNETGNTLDVALSGPGWFAIETPQGTAFTRDGRLQIDPFGELRTVNGHAVLDSAQAPIVTNPTGGRLEVTPDGRIRQDGRFVAGIGVFEIPDGALTTRYENAAFLTNAQSLPIAPGGETKVMQGFVESSNVDAMSEMASLIAITRTFESLSSTIREAEDAMATAVRDLGNTNG